jgi:nitroreductase
MNALLAHLLDAAGRAPSAHNTQPWLLSWLDEWLEVYVRTDRLLHAADPNNADTFHALGALLENILLTLEQQGYRGEYTVSTQFEQESPVITVRWHASRQDSPDPTLFRMIPIRRTSRVPYTVEPIPPATLEALRAVVRKPCTLHFLTEPDRIQQVRKLVAAAAAEQLKDRSITRELYRWLRFSPRDPRWYCDGLNAACMGWKSWEAYAARLLLAPRVVRLLAWCKLHRVVLANVDQQAPVAPALCLLTLDSEGIPTRIEAGRILQRVWLTAAAQGLVTHPISAAVDVSRTRPQVLELFRRSPDQFHVNLFRLGYSPAVARSPRLPADKILKH